MAASFPIFEIRFSLSAFRFPLSESLNPLTPESLASAAIAIACSKIFGSITTSFAAERFDHSPIPTATKTANATIPHVVIFWRRTVGSGDSKTFGADVWPMFQTNTHPPKSPSDKTVTL